MFNNSFSANDTLELSINNIEDLSGNILDTTVFIIVPDTANSGELLINEILFDPLTGGSDYLEIYNNSAKFIDVYNYLIADYDGAVDNHKIIDIHFVLGPGDLVLLTEDSSSTIQAYPTNDPTRFIQMDLPSFPNDSATVYILTPDSIVVGKFSYFDDMHLELINDPEGVALEKINSSLLDNSASNWHSAAESVGWGTPGLVNSQSYTNGVTNTIFDVQTPVFSPDNDGFEDIAIFSYKLTEPGTVGSVIIYDNNGRIIKRVLNNELLSMEGVVSWDGTNDQGEKSRVGIYLVYFESYNIDGDITSKRASITLKTRF